MDSASNYGEMKIKAEMEKVEAKREKVEAKREKVEAEREKVKALLEMDDDERSNTCKDSAYKQWYEISRDQLNEEKKQLSAEIIQLSEELHDLRVSAPATAAAIKKDSDKILIELLKNVKKTMEKQTKTMEKQTKTMEKQTEVLGGIGEVLEEIGDKDCYDRISESSKPRDLSKSDYENAYKVPVADLKCMITGICMTDLLVAAPTSPKLKNPEDAPTSPKLKNPEDAPTSPKTKNPEDAPTSPKLKNPKDEPTKPKPRNPITLSHLLPRSTDAKERLSLGYAKADIENIRNSLLLCKGIEEAFDHKFLSFVPTDKPFSDNQYKLHIWVESIKLDPIYEGATRNIGDFNDAPLILSVGSAMHNPFKRALSYQAFRAFKMYGKRFGLTELPEDSDTSVYQGAYKQKRLAYARQLAKDAAADAEDDEEQDEAMDEESSVEDI